VSTKTVILTQLALTLIEKRHKKEEHEKRETHRKNGAVIVEITKIKGGGRRKRESESA